MILDCRSLFKLWNCCIFQYSIYVLGFCWDFHINKLQDYYEGNAKLLKFPRAVRVGRNYTHVTIRILHSAQFFYIPFARLFLSYVSYIIRSRMK